MTTVWSGCGTALVTPFSRSGDLDGPAVTRLARRQIENGVHFLVPCGTTGESPTLSTAEKLNVVERVVAEAKGRVPVLAGAGGNDTRAAVSLAQAMEAHGADGILSVTPYYNKPTPEGLYRHYRAIADAVDLPVIVYNVPGRTSCNIDPGTLMRLAEIENIVGVKEASGDLAQIETICHETPESFCVLSGDDALTLDVIALGGVGVISVIANEMPREMSELVDAALAGDLDRARAAQARLLPLMKVNFIESNPIPVKTALAEMGLLESAQFRLPLVPPEPSAREKIIVVLDGLALRRAEVS